MFVLISGPSAILLLCLLAAYAFCKSNRSIILLALLITVLQAGIHSLGMDWNATGVVVGFLFAVLALFKIVYEE